MIRVEPALEPAAFDERVRQPGLSAVAELVGEPAAIERSGPKRKKVADRRADISADKLPDYWTRALDDLLIAYERICAYTGLYIYPVTGAASVDHMIPKSRRWDLVYEWRNYRLACSLMNSRKGNELCVLDPFEVENGWFHLELVGFQVKAAASLSPAIRQRVDDTIRLLWLNDSDCRETRACYADEYWEGQISLARLTRRAPFVAIELSRQGRLRPGDSRE